MPRPGKVPFFLRPAGVLRAGLAYYCFTPQVFRFPTGHRKLKVIKRNSSEDILDLSPGSMCRYLKGKGIRILLELR
jgi:hypothetical protein